MRPNWSFSIHDDPTTTFRMYREIGGGWAHDAEEREAKHAEAKNQPCSPETRLFPNQFPAYDWHDDPEEGLGTETTKRPPQPLPRRIFNPASERKKN